MCKRVQAKFLHKKELFYYFNRIKPLLMKNLNSESTLISSSDNSITLTTHRLFQRNKSLNKEIVLTNFVSYEIMKKRSKQFRNSPSCETGTVMAIEF